jgi:hypothetical protein
MTQISQKATWLKYFRFDVELNQKKKADELDFSVLNQARSLMRQELDGRQRNEFNTMIQVLT